MVFVEESSDHDSLPPADPFWINSIVDPLIKPYHQHILPPKIYQKVFPDFFECPTSAIETFLFLFHNWANSCGGEDVSTNNDYNDSSFRSFWWQYLEHLAAAGVRCQAKGAISLRLWEFTLPWQLLISPDSFLPLEVWRFRGLETTIFQGANC